MICIYSSPMVLMLMFITNTILSFLFLSSKNWSVCVKPRLTWLDVDCLYLGNSHVVAEDSLAGRALHPQSTVVAIKSFPLSLRCLGLACR